MTTRASLCPYIVATPQSKLSEFRQFLANLAQGGFVDASALDRLPKKKNGRRRVGQHLLLFNYGERSANLPLCLSVTTGKQQGLGNDHAVVGHGGLHPKGGELFHRDPIRIDGDV